MAEERKTRAWKLKTGSQAELITDEGLPVCKITVPAKTAAQKIERDSMVRLIKSVPQMFDRLIVARQVFDTLKLVPLRDSIDAVLADIALSPPASDTAKPVVEPEPLPESEVQPVVAAKGRTSRTCKICKKQYKNKASYLKHMDKVHGISEESDSFPVNKDMEEELKARDLLDKATGGA